jgi:trk system potassium uptake protein
MVLLSTLGFEDLKVSLRDTGEILKWSSLLFTVPIIYSILFAEQQTISAYILSGTLIFFFGWALKKIFSTKTETTLKHAFLSTALTWIFFTFFAGIPFIINANMSIGNAFFEAMSALTTTGFSVMTLTETPKSIILWRTFISWVGGLGIIVIALNGVMSTYTRSSKLLVAEGRNQRIRPNLKNTAKQIWIVYFGMTLCGAALLLFFGMDPFSAINYSMSAISTTGLELHAPNITTAEGFWISTTLMLIMIAGAISFSVHFFFFKKKDLKAYFHFSEVRLLIALIIISSLIIFPKMMHFYGGDISEGITHTLFHTVSALTNAGFTKVMPTELIQWDEFTKLVLIILMVIGGGAGSTAGGIKLSRAWLFLKSIYWKTKKSILPERTYFKKDFDGTPVQDEEIKEINQFILIYLMFILIGTLVLTFHGNNLTDSLFEVTSAQGNVGISTGMINPEMPLTAKTMLAINMWIGRLEIIPLMAAAGFLLSIYQRNKKKEE